MSWYASPDGIAAVGTASILSLIVSVLGFGFTLWQLVRVRSAADSANKAIADLKIRFSHFDAIQECTSAEVLLGDLRTVPREDHESLVRLSDELARSLINIAERLDGLDESTRRSLQSSIQRAGAIPGWAEYAAEQVQVANKKHFASLREIHRTLVKVRASIQREQ